MTTEQIAAMAAIIATVAGIARVLVIVGQAQRQLDDLSTRHGELAKETRDRLAATEHRTNGLERWQAAVDAKLAGIHDALVEIRTILQEKRGER